MAEQIISQTTVFFSTADRLFGSATNGYYVTPFMLFNQYQNSTSKQTLRLTLYYVHCEVLPSTLQLDKISLIRIHTTLGLDVYQGRAYSTLLAEFCPYAHIVKDFAEFPRYYLDYLPQRWPPQTTADGLVPGMRIWFTDQDDNILKAFTPVPTPPGGLPVVPIDEAVVGDIRMKFFIELVRDRTDEELEELRSIRQQLQLSFAFQKLLAGIPPFPPNKEDGGNLPPPLLPDQAQARSDEPGQEEFPHFGG